MTAEPLFTQPPKLTERQQLAYDYISLAGIATAPAFGAALHANANCKWCRLAGHWGGCDYAESSGREVLEALRKKGLVKRDRQHAYRRTDQAQPSSQGDFPEGF